MTLEMIFVLGLLAVVMLAFVMEWERPELVALAAFCVLFTVPVGGKPILEVSQAFSVFSNSAPITIATILIPIVWPFQ
jgi:hypothetical protein